MSTPSLIASLLIVAIVIGLVFAGCQATRGGYESAPYKVVRTDGKFEVRDYPPLTVVETPMAATGSDGSFMRLFRFITGSNAAKQKISMTTPVFMSGDGPTTTMAFVMPAKMKSSDIPQPTDGTLAVKELPAGRFAVMRYSGGRTRENEAAALAGLKQWTATEHLQVLPAAVYGYFDPPWMPGFLRRNEVMLRVAM
jgi:SOUL heme-binding protein